MLLSFFFLSISIDISSLSLLRFLISLFKEAFNKDIIINKNDSVVSEKTLVRTDKSFDFNVPSYKEMVYEMKKWVDEHKDIYE